MPRRALAEASARGILDARMAEVRLEAVKTRRRTRRAPVPTAAAHPHHHVTRLLQVQVRGRVRRWAGRVRIRQAGRLDVSE